MHGNGEMLEGSIPELDLYCYVEKKIKKGDLCVNNNKKGDGQGKMHELQFH